MPLKMWRKLTEERRRRDGNRHCALGVVDCICWIPAVFVFWQHLPGEIKEKLKKLLAQKMPVAATTADMMAMHAVDSSN